MADASICELLSMAGTTLSDSVGDGRGTGPGAEPPSPAADHYGRTMVPQELDVQPAQHEDAPGSTTPNPVPDRPAPSG
ncbi:hypothetical protein Skr01_05200 [Sphaerisporangium krabiense]|nr:hypothetical protein Skr01_05200 [Sphaerisporangium krabiense]